MAEHFSLHDRVTTVDRQDARSASASRSASESVSSIDMRSGVSADWIKPAGLLAVLVLAAVTYWLRMQSLAERIRRKMELEGEERQGLAQAQRAEQERVSRELQETLLQAMHGLIWKFQALTERLPADDPVRLSMESALQGADRILVEGRDRVLDLRAGFGGAATLRGQLMEAVVELSLDPAVEFASSSHGPDRPLALRVQSEVIAIASEAMRNAYRHSGASTIELRVMFEPDALRLSVADNGAPRAEERRLVGMGERARGIGATLRIRPGAHGGTMVDLEVPAAIAYAKPLRRHTPPGNEA